MSQLRWPGWSLPEQLSVTVSVQKMELASRSLVLNPQPAALCCLTLEIPSRPNSQQFRGPHCRDWHAGIGALLHLISLISLPSFCACFSLQHALIHVLSCSGYAYSLTFCRLRFPPFPLLLPACCWLWWRLGLGRRESGNSECCWLNTPAVDPGKLVPMHKAARYPVLLCIVVQMLWLYCRIMLKNFVQNLWQSIV